MATSMALVDGDYDGPGGDSGYDGFVCFDTIVLRRGPTIRFFIS